MKKKQNRIKAVKEIT